MESLDDYLLVIFVIISIIIVVYKIAKKLIEIYQDEIKDESISEHSNRGKTFKK